MLAIILASGSPRRRELLTQMGVEFEVVPSNFDEKLDDSRSPEAVAMELALGKALDVAKRYPDRLVIGADTIVTVAGRQLEKPRDEADARAMLELLGGRPNAVTTGVAVVRIADGIQLVGADTATVHFRPYDAQAVSYYLQTGDHMDKAGAYGIQSGAAPLIDYFQGHFDTVMGLPTALLSSLLVQVGVEASVVELTAPVRQVPLD